MPVPTSKKQVQSFMGMIKYFSKFSARLSEIAEPIREMAKEKLPFNWGPEHQSTFIQMKKEIASTPILAYYNPKKQTVLQTDASIKGLGACLLQDEKPVYFPSKVLTDTQKGYVAIELESLAIAWAMEKFHHFISYMQAISFLRLTKSLLKQFCQKVSTKQHPDCKEFWSGYSLSFYSLIYTRIVKPASRLLVPIRW